MLIRQALAFALISLTLQSFASLASESVIEVYCFKEKPSHGII